MKKSAQEDLESSGWKQCHFFSQQHKINEPKEIKLMNITISEFPVVSEN